MKMKEEKLENVIKTDNKVNSGAFIFTKAVKISIGFSNKRDSKKNEKHEEMYLELFAGYQKN